MTNPYATIRAALESIRVCDDMTGEREAALAALAELERAAAQPVAYQYAHPYFGGGKIWREEQRWNGHTSDEARALYTTPPPAHPAPGMFTATEMEHAYRRGRADKQLPIDADDAWLTSATRQLVMERTK